MRLVVSSVLKSELFRIFQAFARYLWAFLVGQEGHTPERYNILAAFIRPSIGREHSLAFLLSLTDILYNVDSQNILEWVYIKYGLSKSGLISKTVATFVLCIFLTVSKMQLNTVKVLVYCF